MHEQETFLHFVWVMNHLDLNIWKDQGQGSGFRSLLRKNAKMFNIHTKFLRSLLWRRTLHWCLDIFIGTCWIYNLCGSIKIRLLTLMQNIWLNKDLCGSMHINSDRFWSIRIHADLCGSGQGQRWLHLHVSMWIKQTLILHRSAKFCIDSCRFLLISWVDNRPGHATLTLGDRSFYAGPCLIMKTIRSLWNYQGPLD